MSPGQRKMSFVVVEGTRDPGCSAVTDGAILGKVCGNVIRISCLIVILKVTANANRKCAFELIITVTIYAIQLGMSPRQCKSGKRGMIKPGIPSVCAMAGRTLR